MKRTFGSALAALRHGWRWLPIHGCYCRISEQSRPFMDARYRPTFALEIAPPSGHGLGESCPNYIIRDWDESILGLVPYMMAIELGHRQVTEYTVLVVNEKGEVQT